MRLAAFAAAVSLVRAARTHDAAAADLTKELTTFLEAGDPIDELDEHGDTPLVVAIRGAKHNALRVLLRHGASVQLGDSLGRAPLHVAAATGNALAARLLVEGGAAVSELHSDGLYPLHRAVQGNESRHTETAVVLVELGAYPDQPTHSAGEDLARRHVTPIELTQREETRAALAHFLLESWRLSPFWREGASDWLTTVTLVTSGTLDDFTDAVRLSIVSSFANAAGVSTSRVSLEVTPASVLLSISIASTSRDAAQAVQAMLAPRLATASAAAELMPRGVSVVSTPKVSVSERPVAAGELVGAELRSPSDGQAEQVASGDDGSSGSGDSALGDSGSGDSALGDSGSGDSVGDSGSGDSVGDSGSGDSVGDSGSGDSVGDSASGRPGDSGSTTSGEETQ